MHFCGWKGSTITIAILSLTSFNRAIEFVQVFIFEVANGEENLGAAASKHIIIVCFSISMCAVLLGVAYTKSLKQHHNWLVRGIFNVSYRMVQSWHVVNKAYSLHVKTRI